MSQFKKCDRSSGPLDQTLHLSIMPSVIARARWSNMGRTLCEPLVQPGAAIGFTDKLYANRISARATTLYGVAQRLGATNATTFRFRLWPRSLTRCWYQ